MMRRFGALTLSRVFVCCLIMYIFGSAAPANAQLSNWLRHQLLGSSGGNQNSNGPQQNNGGSYPPPPPGRNQESGYNPGYYRQISNPINPLTGMNAQVVMNIYSLPPDVSPQNALPPQRPNPKKAVGLLTEGDQLIAQGDYYNAEQKLFLAYTYDRSNAQVYNDLGVACDRMNHLQAALEYYKEAATLNPNYAQAYYNAGLDEYAYAGPIPGFPLFTKALQLDGTHADWWCWVGNEKVLNGDNSDALYYFTQAIKLNSNYADAYFSRGVLEMRLSEDSAGHADLQKARAINPAYGPSIAKFMTALMAARKVEREIEEAQAAAAKQARRSEQEARNYYQAHQRSITAVVAEGPRYYESAYNQARNDGESTSQAAEAEQAAQDQYNKDVALQNAWENSDYSMMDRINSGEASREDIESYNPSDSSSSDYSGGGGDGGGSGESYSSSEPATSAPEDSDGGGGGGD
jgi:tetratricopeptide (TPR) repeat protein